MFNRLKKCGRFENRLRSAVHFQDFAGQIKLPARNASANTPPPSPDSAKPQATKPCKPSSDAPDWIGAQHIMQQTLDILGGLQTLARQHGIKTDTARLIATTLNRIWRDNRGLLEK